MTTAQGLAKRILDIVVAVSLLILTLFIWIITSLAIKLDSPGPVFFKQRRIGKNQKPFVCYKFRSMVINNDPGVHKKYLQEHYDDIVSPEETESYNNLKNISNDKGKLALKEFTDKELKSMNFQENQNAIMVFLFTVDKENTVSSNNKIKSAHAQGTGDSNVTILSDDAQKYLKNQFVNTPTVKIDTVSIKGIEESVIGSIEENQIKD